MAQLIVLNLEDNVCDRLRDLARLHGRSMEEEIRDILRAAAQPNAAETAPRNLGAWCVAQFGKADLGDPVELPKNRTGPTRSATFE